MARSSMNNEPRRANNFNFELPESLHLGHVVRYRGFGPRFTFEKQEMDNFVTGLLKPSNVVKEENDAGAFDFVRHSGGRYQYSPRCVSVCVGHCQHVAALRID